MKSLIKIYVLPVAFLLALTTQVSAQTAKRTIAKTNTKKSVTIKRIPSNKVTYKTQKKKVVSVRNVPNKTVVNHKGQNYYYANNKYYTQSRGRYIVIAPKVGFRIKTLPANYKRVQFNNGFYFNVNGTFYTQTNNEYEVVDPEVGTIVYELPEDYEKVVINGETFYEYANILYEKVQYDGTRAYEVVGIIEMN